MPTLGQDGTPDGHSQTVFIVPEDSVPGKTCLKVDLGRTIVAITLPEKAKPGDKLIFRENGHGEWACRLKRTLLEDDQTSLCPVQMDTCESGSGVCDLVSSDATHLSGLSTVPASTSLPCGDDNLDVCFAKMVETASRAGASWSKKLVRGTVAPLNVPGIVACEPIAAGEILCRIPAALHISVASCQQAMPKVFQAFETLGFNSDDRRHEAAHVFCLAQLLKSAGGESSAPPVGGVGAQEDANVRELWQWCAKALSSMDFGTHPYCRCLAEADGLAASLHPSGEAEHVEGQARYVLGVHAGLRDSSELTAAGLAGVDADLFLKAWLCLLTREFGGAHGSALVPLVEFFNHSPDPGADQDWDDEADAVVVRARRAHVVGEEVLISYAPLSNPLLFRTYGFTVLPEAEPSWTCTFLESEALQAADPELSDQIASMPNVHIDASQVTDTLAAVLAAFANSGHDGASFLRGLCCSKVARYEQEVGLRAVLGALASARAKARSNAAWWSELPAESIPTANADVVRVQMSEYLCLVAHLEALDLLAGRISEDECLSGTQGLRQDLMVLHRAGLVQVNDAAGRQVASNDEGPRTE
mmetsp:Transcript_124616/g.363889  ORF Transcript_124616/g.363889 Transcript_124616/m.363889 type:complete len:588 (-) Transcript_124616:55-1818(-)